MLAKKSTKCRSKAISVADDYGISRVANRNILKLIRSSKVDRVSVLIDYNPAHIKEKDVKALLVSKIKIDLHLNYQVLLKKPKVRKLKDGVVGRTINFVLGYLAGRGRAKQVEKAWEAQIKQFIKVFGKAPDGLNSHQHIHLFPAYLNVALKLAKKYHIPHVRYGKTGMIKSRHRVYYILNWLRYITKTKVEKSECKSSDYLVSLHWIKDIDDFRQNLPAGTTEIVCHPECEDEFKLMMKSL